MVPLTQQAIAIELSGIIHGLYKFFCLTLEEKITRQAFTELKMLQLIIKLTKLGKRNMTEKAWFYLMEAQSLSSGWRMILILNK